jgi:hypothetical protein
MQGGNIFGCTATVMGDKKGGDARIELATSCTLSKNHTTRPITHIRTTTVGNESNNAFFLFRDCKVQTKHATTTPSPAQSKKKGVVPPAGIEPATNRLKVERST